MKSKKELKKECGLKRIDNFVPEEIHDELGEIIRLTKKNWKNCREIKPRLNKIIKDYK